MGRSLGALRWIGTSSQGRGLGVNVERRSSRLAFANSRDRAVVSEPFALKHQIRPGDRLTVPIGGQLVELTVAGVYYDYSSSQGYANRRHGLLRRFLIVGARRTRQL